MDKSILYVIDLDRTLIGFEQVMGLTGRACSEIGIDFSSIKAQQLQVTKDAQPYSPLRTVDAMGEGKLAEFKQAFFKLAEPDELLFPDARRYLDRLNELEQQYTILTYATEAEWQKMKLQAAGLIDTPHMITFNQNKSEDIAGWIDDAGKFSVHLQGIEPTERIVFIDDRLRAFNKLPKDCEGYLMDRFGQEVNTAMPEHVSRITSFDQIIDKI